MRGREKKRDGREHEKERKRLGDDEWRLIDTEKERGHEERRDRTLKWNTSQTKPQRGMKTEREVMHVINISRL